MIRSEGQLRLRWVEPEDLPQLVDLHRACVPREAWTAEDFYKFIGNHSDRVNVVKALVDAEGVVHGSLLYTVSADEVRIRRINVWPDNRREGIGTFMLESLIGPRSPVRQPLITAKVDNRNATAQVFFYARGFREDESVEEKGHKRYEFVKQPALLTG